jgi:hypothetical protein
VLYSFIASEISSIAPSSKQSLSELAFVVSEWLEFWSISWISNPCPLGINAAESIFIFFIVCNNGFLPLDRTSIVYGKSSEALLTLKELFF